MDTPYLHMEFEKVDVLIPGQKYKIMGEQEYIRTFSMFNFRIDALYAIFLPDLCLPLSSIYRPIFKKEQIQQAMERRAINLILQKVTNDPSFYW
jgi:hypothetical protein